MTVSSSPAAGRSSGVVLASLLLGTFIAGSAELLPVGLLPMISAGLSVSIAAAGGLVSAYALGLAIGGPLLTALTMRLDRRHVLVGSLVIFAILVVSPAAIPDYGWFVVTRLGAGAMQGLFMTVAFLTATSVVPAERAGRALSVVIAGFAISTVVGLPLGVVAGSVLGWRGALLAVGGCALAVALLLSAAVSAVPGSQPIGVGELRHALSTPVVAMLVLSLALFAAPAAVMTYVMPLLEQVVGLSGPSATGVLVGYGTACVAGSFLGGRLADANAARALVLAALGVTTSLVILYVARGEPMFAVIAILGWALFSSSAPPSVQHRTVSLAGPGGALAASLPASAASAGIALGTTASGFAYTSNGPSAVILTGILIALGALALAIATRRLQPPAGEHADFDDSRPADLPPVSRTPTNGESTEGDTIFGGVEDVITGSGNDVIRGNNGDNVLHGRGGIDVIVGLRGKDSVIGGDGDDFLFGDIIPNHPEDVNSDGARDSLVGDVGSNVGLDQCTQGTQDPDQVVACETVVVDN